MRNEEHWQNFFMVKCKKLKSKRTIEMLVVIGIGLWYQETWIPHAKMEGGGVLPPFSFMQRNSKASEDRHSSKNGNGSFITFESSFRHQVESRHNPSTNAPAPG